VQPPGSKSVDDGLGQSASAPANELVQLTQKNRPSIYDGPLVLPVPTLNEGSVRPAAKGQGSTA
jgi:hypothetical protein